MINKDQVGKCALITGASSGIGLELARIHASRGGDLVLVARREALLDEWKTRLQKEFQVGIHVIGTDLSLRESPVKIVRALAENDLSIDYLINNAGFSRQGFFPEIDWSVHQSMINVMILSMAEITHLILPDMIRRQSGRILNVASSAAFAPGGPLQSVYYASKAFIVSFSRGLAGELAGTGISVTALCPGATATEFEQTSGLDRTDLFSIEKVFSAEEVARDGYEAMLKGELVRLTALTPVNKFVLKNMNLFPARKILEQIRIRQEVKKF